MKYSLHTDERETILLYNMTDGYWDVSTSVPSHMTKFKKLGWELVNDNGYELSFRVPKNAVAFKDLQKLLQRKPMTEEERAKKRELMLRLHQAKNSREESHVPAP